MKKWYCLIFFLASSYASFSQCASSGNTGSTYISEIYFPETGDPKAGLIASSDNGYEDHTGLGSVKTYSRFSQSVNNQFGMSFEVPAAGIDYVYKIWIDFNGDNTINNSGELVWQGTGTSTAAGQLNTSASFNLPSSAVSGAVVMRFIIKEGTSISDPCISGFNGEVEDVIVTLPDPVIYVNSIDVTLLNPGQNIEVDYSLLGNLNSGNVLTAQLSDATGDFSSPIDIGTHATTDASGSFTTTVPMGTPEGTGYRIRITSSDPPAIGETYVNSIEITNRDLSETILNPGDIVIVCFNADGTDGFSFITLVNIKEGTRIYFKDAGWQSDDRWYNNNNTTREGTVTFTAPANVTAGDYFRYDKNNATTDPWSSTDIINNIGTSGDQIIAYQGDFLDPRMIYAVHNRNQNNSSSAGGVAGWNADASNDFSSALPKGLTDGVNALAFSHQDNYAYIGSVDSGTADELRTAVANTSNWTGHSSSNLVSSCPSDGFTVIQSGGPFGAVLSDSSDVSCSGNSDGSLTVSVINGTAPYTYVWSNGSTFNTNDTSTTISGLAPGNYSVTVSDNQGGSEVVNASVGTPTAISASISTVQDVDCFGGTNGELTVNVSGGTTPYAISWNTGASTSSISGLSAGAYSVTVDDANNCGAVNDNTTLTEPSQVVVTTNTDTEVSCNGVSDGAVSVSVNGGTSPYNYSWNTGASTAGISGLIAGTYTVSVTDDNGCGPFAEPITLTQPDAIVVDGQISQHVSCTGGNDGSVTAVVSGGTTPYTYAWSNSATTSSVSGLTAGNYTVTVTDASSCTGSDNSVLVTEPGALSVSINVDQLLSCGSSNGALTANVTGGTSPYTYSWSNGENTASISGLSASSYTVTVDDANNCGVVQDTEVLTSSGSLNISLAITDVSCFGNSDGQITASVSGGTGPYTYSWSNGETTATISNINAGNYAVTVNDAGGCGPEVANGTVSEPGAVTASININNEISCAGGNDGALSVTAGGGTSPYTYLWSNGGTTQSITALAAATYGVQVTDAGGCHSAMEQQVLNDGASVTASINIDNEISCAGRNDGALSVTAGGGTSPYTYLWSNGGTTQSITALAAATYGVQVTDADGCHSAMEQQVLNDGASVTASITTDNEISCVGNDGALSATVSGGATPYTYLWSNGATTSSITGLVQGNYTLTVTDANACVSNQASTNLTSSGLLSATAQVDNHVSCAAGTDGTLSVSINGGQAPFTYLWSNGATTSSLSGASAGIYSVQVTDANNCSTTSNQVEVTAPAAIAVSLIIDNQISCAGLSDAALHVEASGGTSPYSYTWSNGATTSSISNAGAGNYNVVVVDANGCAQLSATESITEPGAISAVVNEVSAITCAGSNNGVLQAEVSGGTSPYQITWSTGANGVQISGLGAGSYNFSVNDANNCSSLSNTVSLTEPSAITGTIQVDQAILCNGDANGSLTSSISGGSTPYNYVWSNGESTASISGLEAGNYSLVVTDANGCPSPVMATTLSEPSMITIEEEIIQTIACSADKGIIGVNVSGGSSPYSYLWNNNATGSQISDLDAGSYNVVVTDAHNCSATSETIVLTSPNLLNASIAVFNHVTCNGGSDGLASVNVSGGQAPYTYLWSNGGTSPFASNLPAGEVTVEISDASGCATPTVVIGQINQPEAIQATAEVIQHVSCFNGNDGIVTVSLVNGQAPFSYLWNNGASTAQVSALNIGNYSTTVVDANGCVGQSTSVQVMQPEALHIDLSVDQEISCYNSNDGALSVSANGGTAPYTYSWSNGVTTAVNTGLSEGIYVVEVNDANNCGVVNQSVLLEEPGAQVAHAGSDQLFEYRDSTFMEASEPSAGQGTWTQLAGETLTIHDINDPHTEVSGFDIGEYLLVWSVGSESCGSSDTVKIVVTVISGNSDVAGHAEMDIYPNPVSDQLFIQLSNEHEIIGVELINDIGVMELLELQYSGNTVKVESLNKPAGTYILLIHTDNGLYTRRVNLLGSSD